MTCNLVPSGEPRSRWSPLSLTQGARVIVILPRPPQTALCLMKALQAARRCSRCFGLSQSNGSLHLRNWLSALGKEFLKFNGFSAKRFVDLRVRSNSRFTARQVSERGAGPVSRACDSSRMGHLITVQFRLRADRIHQREVFNVRTTGLGSAKAYSSRHRSSPLGSHDLSSRLRHRIRQPQVRRAELCRRHRLSRSGQRP